MFYFVEKLLKRKTSLKYLKIKSFKNNSLNGSYMLLVIMLDLTSVADDFTHHMHQLVTSLHQFSVVMMIMLMLKNDEVVGTT